MKAGDFVILCFSTIIPTYLKVLNFRNYFEEVNKISLMSGTYPTLSITKFVRLYKDSLWLVVLRLNVPVNNFTVMSGRSHRFLGN